MFLIVTVAAQTYITIIWGSLGCFKSRKWENNRDLSFTTMSTHSNLCRFNAQLCSSRCCFHTDCANFFELTIFWLNGSMSPFMYPTFATTLKKRKMRG